MFATQSSGTSGCCLLNSVETSDVGGRIVVMIGMIIMMMRRMMIIIMQIYILTYIMCKKNALKACQNIFILICSSQIHKSLQKSPVPLNITNVNKNMYHLPRLSLSPSLLVYVVVCFSISGITTFCR